MKANTRLSENCSERLSPKKGSFQSHVSNSFIIILLGLFFVSAMSRPVYMSFQTAMQMLEPASSAHLQSLVTDTHPTAYLTKGEISLERDGSPIVAVCDAASIHLLYGNNPALSQIELIRITATSINGLPDAIDLNQMGGLPNMKYLLVEFAYDACGGSTDDCHNSILEGIMQGTSSQITVIYSHSFSE